MTKEEIKMTGLVYRKHIQVYTKTVVVDIHPYDPSITKEKQLVFSKEDVKKMSVGDLCEVLAYASKCDYHAMGDRLDKSIHSIPRIC